MLTIIPVDVGRTLLEIAEKQYKENSFGCNTPDKDLVRYIGVLDKQVTLRPTTKESFFRTVSRSDILVLGEYHTVAEHHISNAQLVEDFAREGLKFGLGLEFLPARKTPYVGSLRKLRQQLTRHHALDDVFQFDLYVPLLKIARDLNIPLYGISYRGTNEEAKDIKERCDDMAKNAIYIKKNAGLDLLVVAVGDAHAHPTHLARMMQDKTDATITTVQQDTNRTYDAVRKYCSKQGAFFTAGNRNFHRYVAKPEIVAEHLYLHVINDNDAITQKHILRHLAHHHHGKANEEYCFTGTMNWKLLGAEGNRLKKKHPIGSYYVPELGLLHLTERDRDIIEKINEKDAEE